MRFRQRSLPWSTGLYRRPVRGDHGSPGFSTAAWVMTLGSVMPLVIIPFAMKKIQNSIGKAVSKNTAWADVMSAAAFIGLISAFVGRAIVGPGRQGGAGRRRRDHEHYALAVSMLSMLLFMQIEKKKKIAWLQSMAMPLAMFIGMGAVMLLAKVLPTHIAWLEWRG